MGVSQTAVKEIDATVVRTPVFCFIESTQCRIIAVIQQLFILLLRYFQRPFVNRVLIFFKLVFLDFPFSKRLSCFFRSETETFRTIPRTVAYFVIQMTDYGIVLFIAAGQ